MSAYFKNKAPLRKKVLSLRSSGMLLSNIEQTAFFCQEA